MNVHTYAGVTQPARTSCGNAAAAGSEGGGVRADGRHAAGARVLVHECLMGVWVCSMCQCMWVGWVALKWAWGCVCVGDVGIANVGVFVLG
jgi:hypothetical protein